MRLEQLTAGVAAGIRGGDPAGGAIEISSLAYDSRAVRPGALFFCVRGFQSDGHDYAPAAIAAGAAALVVERPLGGKVPEIEVGSARAAMAPIAARFFGSPTDELSVVGVTGTNGKTTTAYLVRALLEASGHRCGLLGTVTSIVGGEERPVARTTPEAIDLQGCFREMLDAGDHACAMEVSSHALTLGRADCVRFACAVFTNITRDHLDFHDTMEEYFMAKRRLFVAAERSMREPAEDGVRQVNVVNVADPFGRRLAAELGDVCTFALDAPADYSASDVVCDLSGCRFRLSARGQVRDVASPLSGRFNVANALGALAAAEALGAELDTLVAALERGVRVPGRLEAVDEGQGFAVLVDYAHTPDSLENVLRTARELADVDAERRVVCVFGAGGDRDRGKRPLMGAVAGELADVAIVTSDNPRSESPESIIEEILAGVPAAAGARVQRTSDRAAAIGEALQLAREGDVVVIAGKGHEQGQELAGGRKIPFDDVTVAREALRRLGRARGGASGAGVGIARR